MLFIVKMGLLRKKNANLTLQILVFASTCANVLSVAITQDNGASRPNTFVSAGRSQGERVDIVYHHDVFKEIEPDSDIYRVEGNLNNIILECVSTKGRNASIEWVYHGLKEHDLELTYSRNLIWLKNFTSGPPVLRLECVDKDDESISNNTYIYSGDGHGPFLYNNGNSVDITVLNETTVRLPCLLNYPLDDNKYKELQLFKDGVEIDKKNSCLNYIPEYGYLLNLTKLEQPLGNYECKVKNSTDNDFLKMTLQQDDITRALVEVKYYSSDIPFYEGDPIKRVFYCKIPKSKFEDRFSWYFLWKNGSYTPINPEKSNTTHVPDPLRFVDWVKFEFSSVNISHVVCAGYLKDNATSYNNTHAVVIKAPTKPKIVHAPLDGPIIYKKGGNLTCSSVGEPITFKWLKDGSPAPPRLNTENYYVNDIRTSVILLDPSVDDVDSNYTCEVSNFLGTANFSYRVQLKEDEPQDEETARIWPVIAVFAAVLLILFILLFTFYELKPRRFPREKINRFFQGILPGEVPYAEFADQTTEPYECVSYDKTREINIQSLSVVRELKGGNFGKVQHGIYFNTNEGTSIHVAIKSIKDNRNATKEEIDEAFDSFLAEIKLMQVLGEHEHVVKYIGAVTSDIQRYSAYLVVEYCCEGDLQTYLQAYQENGGSFYDDIQGLYDDRYRPHKIQGSMSRIVLKTSHLMKWAEDIASGMEYVASKRLIHRDLAARNVLLSYERNNCEHPSPEHLTAKISDFGLSRDLHDFHGEYYQIIMDPQAEHQRKIKLPLRWMAVEALEGLRFTTHSDVWAYGITLWEIFNFGKRPYDDFKNEELRANLVAYFRQNNASPLLQPDFAPGDIWDIMQQCWNLTPAERPDFMQLKMILHAINENVENRENQDEFEEEPPVQLQQATSGYTTVDFVQNLGYNDSNDEGESEEEYDMESVQET